MTNWTREFIGGQVIYVVRPELGDFIGAANTVFQLLPTLLVGEEIRIRPGGNTTIDQPEAGPYNASDFVPPTPS